MLRWRGLPLQLFVLIILPLTALLLIIAFGGLFLHQRSMRQMVGERDERATRAAASAIAEQLAHRQAAVRGLALRASDLDAPEHVLADAAFLLPDFDGGIGLFADGRLLATTNDAATWEQTALATLGQDGEPAAVEAVFGGPVAIDGERQLMLVAAPGPEGILAVGAFSPAAVAAEALNDIFMPGDRATAILTDQNGRLLFQIGDSYRPGTDLSGYAGVPDALRGGSGTRYLREDGSEEVIAYSAIPPLNWALVMKEPWQAVADPLLRATEWAPLVLAPVLIIALIGLYFGLRQIIQPLQSLEQKAAALGWGNYAAIEEPVGGIYEIQRLQTEMIHMAHKVDQAQQSLRGYLGAVTVGQEEERRRLARDLHDDTIQSLIALNQRIQLAQLSADRDSAAGRLLEMQQMTEQTINDLRRLTHDLRPIYLEDLGLVTALHMLARDTAESLGIAVDFDVLGDEYRLPPAVELAFFRIAQEAMSNVARHAQAEHATLRLTFEADQTTMTIADNGSGFTVPESPAEMTGSGHFGLLGIQERAELIGARLQIESTPGAGTRLAIVLFNQAKMV